VALLLDNNAPRDDAENKAGVTPVFVAAEMNHPDVIELLVSRGADISKPESHGYSAMTRAFWRGNKEVVSLLKQYGQTCQQDKLTQTEYAQCLDIK
jgi:ankyrin repeat protein